MFEVIQKAKSRVSRIAVVCLIAAFIFGYELADINAVGPMAVLGITQGPLRPRVPEPDSPLDTHEGVTFLAVTNALFFIGTAVGAMMGGKMGDTVGRKLAVEFSYMLYLMGGCLEILMVPMTAAVLIGNVSFNAGYFLFCLGRLLNGLSVGASNVTVLLYLLEVVPKASLRGVYSTYFQLFITLGIVIPNALGLLYQPLWLRESELGVYFWSSVWNQVLSRLIVALPMVLSIVSIALLVSLPESPVYLLLQSTRTGDHSKDSEVDQILNQIDQDFAVTPQPVDRPHPRRAEIEKVANAPHRSVFAAILDQPPATDDNARTRVKGTRRAILAGILLVILVQSTGVNVIFTTANGQLLRAGFSASQAYAASFALSCWNFLITIPMLMFIEKSGRTSLLQMGAGGAILGTLMVFSFSTIYTGPGSLWMLLAGLFIYVTAYAMGIGSVMFLYINEILPADIRSEASGIIISTNWLWSGLVVVGGALLTQEWLFTIMVAASCGLLILACVLPETKGLSFGTSPFTKVET